jgi:hypothetical protein
VWHAVSRLVIDERPRTVPVLIRTVLGICVAVGVSAAGGCGQSGTQHPTPQSAGGSTVSPGLAGVFGAQGLKGLPLGSGSPVPDTSTPPAAPSASAGAAVLPDGKSAAYLKTVDTQGRTVTFDLVELLFGDAATKEYVKTHPDEPDGPPEGYLLVNDNTKLRTIPLAAQLSVKIVDMNGDPSVPKSIKLGDLSGHLSNERQAPLPYWMTVTNGQVTAIEEQYLA